MPELPEVEITRQGLLPLVNQTVRNVVIRNASMRWPIPDHLLSTLKNKKLLGLKRRAKYILAQFENGTLLIHLGMSGHISLLDRSYPAEKHDHFDIQFQNKQVLRLTDPRRFGAVLWGGDVPEEHALLSKLGPEPLDPAFNAEYLHHQLQSRKAPIKNAIMDAHLVVGVGNIYASESLFRACIDPQRAANKLSFAMCEKLVTEVKATLGDALKAGGSSLRDFSAVNGKSGYFQQTYFVYARAGEPCKICGALINNIRLGQRSTFYCAGCQK